MYACAQTRKNGLHISEKSTCSNTHGLPLTRLQSYADEFSWRYSHRGRDATTALLADCCAGYYSRDQLKREVFLPQPVPPKPPKRPRGRPRKHPILQL